MSYVTDIVSYFMVLIEIPHIILFFFLALVNMDFFEVIGLEKTVDHCGAERAGAASDEKGFILDLHCINLKV